MDKTEKLKQQVLAFDALSKAIFAFTENESIEECDKYLMRVFLEWSGSRKAFTQIEFEDSVYSDDESEG